MIFLDRITDMTCSTSARFASVLIGMAYFVALCASGFIPSVASAEPRDTGSAAFFVRQPKPASILLEDGRAIALKLGADGTLPNTVDGPKGSLAIESQRSAYYVVAAGVLSHAAERDELLDKGLKAFEWGFDQAGPSGSFPDERGGAEKNENSLYAKSAFLGAASRSLLLLQQADLAPGYRERVAALLERLLHSARWMAGSSDLEKFFKRAKRSDKMLTNQLFSIAVALQETGVMTGDQSLTRRAQELVERILPRQSADGTFPEKGGFDAKYQTVSLEHLARYANTLPDSPWRNTVMAALRKGTDRFVQAVDSAGVIDNSANTRTMACGQGKAGDGPKGREIDIVPLRLLYIGYVLDETPRLEPLADQILAVGQKLTKERKCGK